MFRRLFSRISSVITRSIRSNSSDSLKKEPPRLELRGNLALGIGTLIGGLSGLLVYMDVKTNVVNRRQTDTILNGRNLITELNTLVDELNTLRASMEHKRDMSIRSVVYGQPPETPLDINEFNQVEEILSRIARVITYQPGIVYRLWRGRPSGLQQHVQYFYQRLKNTFLSFMLTEYADVNESELERIDAVQETQKLLLKHVNQPAKLRELYKQSSITLKEKTFVSTSEFITNYDLVYNCLYAVLEEVKQNKRDTIYGVPAFCIQIYKGEADQQEILRRRKQNIDTLKYLFFGPMYNAEDRNDQQRLDLIRKEVLFQNIDDREGQYRMIRGGIHLTDTEAYSYLILIMNSLIHLTQIMRDRVQRSVDSQYNIGLKDEAIVDVPVSSGPFLALFMEDSSCLREIGYRFLPQITPPSQEQHNTTTAAPPSPPKTN
jgi:hypothetical protein